jgi:hypothetical protein
VWLLWKSKPATDGGKSRKVPFYSNGAPRSGTLDAPEDRARLVYFATATATLTPAYAGLGVALGEIPGDEIIVSGTDLDNCRDATTGELDARAVAILAAANSYAEVSPSGCGIKIFGTGDVGTTKATDVAGGLEIYSGGRFFTVTGDAINLAGLADLHDAAKLARELFAVKQERPRFVPRPLPPGGAVARVQAFDAMMKEIGRRGLYMYSRQGWHIIVCPWSYSHTGGDCSGAAIAEPSTANNWAGGFRCHHAHCGDRRISDIYRWARTSRKVAA